MQAVSSKSILFNVFLVVLIVVLIVLAVVFYISQSRPHQAPSGSSFDAALSNLSVGSTADMAATKAFKSLQVNTAPQANQKAVDLLNKQLK